MVELIQTAINSSTNDPKYMSISTVKLADLLGETKEDIEQGLQELLNEGRLRKAKLDHPPHTDIYLKV